MPNNDCQECLVKDIQKIHSLVEKKLTGRLPEEVAGPLLEAKKQVRLAIRGLVTHLLEEEPAGNEKQQGMSRRIKLE